MPKSICCDISTNEDLLGFKPYVEAIAEFLTDKNTESPITLSIEGQWGCGKSSLMKQLKQNIEMRNLSKVKIRVILKYLFLRGREDIEIIILRHILSELFIKKGKSDIKNSYSLIDRLKVLILYVCSKIKRRRYFTIWFNCWRYEKEEELWAAFAINLMDQLSEQLSLLHFLLAKFRLGHLRLKWKGRNSIYFIPLFISALYAFFVYSVPKIREILSSNPNIMSYSIVGSLFSSLLVFTGILLTITPTLRTVKDIKDAIVNPFDFSKFVSNPNYTEHISFIENFHSDFGKIIKSYAGNSRVYIFVDDLDRCEISKAAEIMQAINLMISDEANIYFCIGMDRKVISAGFATKHENFLKYLNDDGLEYGYKFIEKFIQLPFKVPSPKNENFKDFVTSHYGKDSSSKAYKLPYNLLSKFLEKFRHFHSNQLSNEENIQMKSTEDIEYEKTNNEEVKKERSSQEQEYLNAHDCDPLSNTNGLSKNFEHIIEMVAPALDRNPRRIKQFLNLFRFQRTIGLKTGLFSYNKGTNPDQMWNCKKLAKFVAISINWPSIISALNSNTRLLEELQEYALKLEKENNETEEENKKIEKEYKKLGRWVKDEKLIKLLREGCEESDNTSYNLKAEYSLSNLDFSKLLQISPIIVPIISFNNLAGEELMKRLVGGRSNLVKADLKGAKLKGIDLERANLEQADLTQADLTQADLEFANLTQTTLLQANLKEANLKGADLTGADLTQAKLMQAKLMQADLTQTNLIQANLTEAILIETDFRGANLTQTTLLQANLKGSNLARADLTGADLTGADLYRADLHETKLIQANFEGANLKGAYNLTTDQLYEVETLYDAKLGKELEIPLRDKYPELFEKRK